MKQKWYLNSILISVLFFCWFFYGIPLLIGIILLVFKVRNEKKLYAQLNELISDNQRYVQMMTPEMQDAVIFQKHIESLRQEEAAINNRINGMNNKAIELECQIERKKKQLISFDDEILVQEFGLYKPQFEFATALDYKEELAKIRILQKDLIKKQNCCHRCN